MFTRSAGSDSRLTAILCLKELVPAPALWGFKVPAYFSPFPGKVQQASHEGRHSQTLPGQLSAWSFCFLKLLGYILLCDPIDCIVHGILQARVLEWVTFPFSRGSSHPRDWTQVSHIAGGFFTSWAINNLGIPQDPKVQREVLLSSRRRPSLTAKTNVFYFFPPGLPGTDLESQQCHAFWRALHRKQMFKFSLGSWSFAVDNSLAHLSAWGTATQLMVGGDWVPTEERRGTTACWSGQRGDRLWLLRQQAEALRRSRPRPSACCWLPVLLAESPGPLARAFSMMDGGRLAGPLHSSDLRLCTAWLRLWDSSEAGNWMGKTFPVFQN